MKFKLPTLTGLDRAELDKLLAAALDEANGLSGIDPEKISDAELDDLDALATAIESIKGEITSVETAAADRVARLDRARGIVEKAGEKEDDKPETDESKKDDEDDADKIVDATKIPDDASELVDAEKKEAVAASGKPSVSRALAGKTTKDLEKVVDGPKASIVAAANVPGVVAGAELGDFDQLTSAFMAKARNMVVGSYEKVGVAQIRRPDSEFLLNGNAGADYQTIMDAAKEARLPGGSLVAAGGWCSPSETVYDFCSLESASDLLDLPSVTIKRGGINFTKGPDYATVAATMGFTQTEAQAIAGAVKNIVHVACPPFAEVRLDAIGFGVSAGILTEHTYPELIRRYIEIATVGHAHRLNAYKIAKLQGYLGAAINFTETQASTSDVLSALALNAQILREKFSMPKEATMEVVAPVWLLEQVRADLANRTGVDMLAVSDEQIRSYFSVRKLAVQWIADYQTIAANNGQAFPATVEVMMYPAGTFVTGGDGIISLGAVYDRAGLEVNDYLAAFEEESILVANTCGSGVRVSIALNVFGRTGAATVGALAVAA